jgi:hypothetical protein
MAESGIVSPGLPLSPRSLASDDLEFKQNCTKRIRLCKPNDRQAYEGIDESPSHVLGPSTAPLPATPHSLVPAGSPCPVQTPCGSQPIEFQKSSLSRSGLATLAQSEVSTPVSDVDKKSNPIGDGTVGASSARAGLGDVDNSCNTR